MICPLPPWFSTVEVLDMTVNLLLCRTELSLQSPSESLLYHQAAEADVSKPANLNCFSVMWKETVTYVCCVNSMNSLLCEMLTGEEMIWGLCGIWYGSGASGTQHAGCLWSRVGSWSAWTTVSGKKEGSAVARKIGSRWNECLGYRAPDRGNCRSCIRMPEAAWCV